MAELLENSFNLEPGYQKLIELGLEGDQPEPPQYICEQTKISGVKTKISVLGYAIFKDGKSAKLPWHDGKKLKIYTRGIEYELGHAPLVKT